MDATEEHARKYLLHLGFQHLDFEPDGNTPPDFLAEKRIAVEVRRLSQTEPPGVGSRGLEETEIPLQRLVGRVLRSFGPSRLGVSWFVSITFNRPLPQRKQLESIKFHLEAFSRDSKNNHSERIGDTIELEFMAADDAQPAFFVPGACVDDDSGGSVFGETQRNVDLCIQEKTRRIAPFRHKYPEWWLILIGYKLDGFDRKLYREQLGISHTWDKVILLSPVDHRSAFDVPNQVTQ